VCPSLVDHPNKMAAITDWVFNLGAGNLRHSTLAQKINSGAWDDVPAQIRRWVYAGGKVQAGLVTRREREVQLWESADDERSTGTEGVQLGG
jgi:lysozyme